MGKYLSCAEKWLLTTWRCYIMSELNYGGLPVFHKSWFPYLWNGSTIVPTSCSCWMKKVPHSAQCLIHSRLAIFFLYLLVFVLQLMDDNDDQKGLWLPGQASVPYMEMFYAFFFLFLWSQEVIWPTWHWGWHHPSLLLRRVCCPLPCQMNGTAPTR